MGQAQGAAGISARAQLVLCRAAPKEHVEVLLIPESDYAPHGGLYGQKNLEGSTQNAIKPLQLNIMRFRNSLPERKA